jgi:L-histidine N-alpha-methyltransferase
MAASRIRRPAMKKRFQLVGFDSAPDRRATMARDVRAGLTNAPRTIPPKYFYDAEGSRLFDAICALPEYYLTRAEHALLAEHAADVVARAGSTVLLEVGSGMARKTGLLLGAMAARGDNVLYVPFDIDPEALRSSARALVGAHPRLHVRGVVGDFSQGLGQLAMGAGPGVGPRLFAFLGSTIGNLDEAEAPALVGEVARLMNAADSFLLGIDLVKDPRVLQAAYDDSAGVTARFNRNILHVLSAALDGDLDPARFEHVAEWNAEKERVDIYLEARQGHTATLRELGMRIAFAGGERIQTEISRKFTRASVARTLAQAGMHEECWYEGGGFALVLARRR